MNIVSTSPSLNLIGKLISDEQTRQNLSDADIAKALGFEKTILVSLIRGGTIKFPLAKIRDLAALLDMNAGELLVAAMQDSSPDLLALIEDVWGPRTLTPAEGRLIQHCRKLADGREVSPVVFADTVIALVVV